LDFKTIGNELIVPHDSPIEAQLSVYEWLQPAAQITSGQ
jgi:hypothetical protein